ncbi:hypothetical protein [Prolixibacter sp. SD074]|uniref:hypothetical protein n=1 Tax=Prolixibacter sp. SD074 TaxID=2652391 RepID=UPI00129938A4|nr:hypothetical protein [Prolixibacter sp. SD074]
MDKNYKTDVRGETKMVKGFRLGFAVVVVRIVSVVSIVDSEPLTFDFRYWMVSGYRLQVTGYRLSFAVSVVGIVSVVRSGLSTFDFQTFDGFTFHVTGCALVFPSSHLHIFSLSHIPAINNERWLLHHMW